MPVFCPSAVMMSPQGVKGVVRHQSEVMISAPIVEGHVMRGGACRLTDPDGRVWSRSNAGDLDVRTSTGVTRRSLKTFCATGACSFPMIRANALLGMTDAASEHQRVRSDMRQRVWP